MMLAYVGIYNLQEVNAATEVQTTHSKVIDVPDYTPSGKQKCTNLGTMQIVGNDIYCLKSNNEGTASVLYRITNYKTAPKIAAQYLVKQGSSVASLGKANGMAYYNGLFYVATMKTPSQGNQIIAISKEGVIKEKYKCTSEGSDFKVTAITYYQNGDFIIKSSKGFSTVKLLNGEIKFGTTFSVDILKTPEVSSQDIHFEEGYLYVVQSIKSASESYTKRNRILKISLKNGVTAGIKYSPSDILIDNSTSSNTTQYELESVDLVGTTKYVCVNVLGNGKTDGIYIITRK